MRNPRTLYDLNINGADQGPYKWNVAGDHNGKRFAGSGICANMSEAYNAAQAFIAEQTQPEQPKARGKGKPSCP